MSSTQERIAVGQVWEHVEFPALSRLEVTGPDSFVWLCNADGRAGKTGIFDEAVLRSRFRLADGGSA